MPSERFFRRHFVFKEASTETDDFPVFDMDAYRIVSRYLTGVRHIEVQPQDAVFRMEDGQAERFGQTGAG